MYELLMLVAQATQEGQAPPVPAPFWVKYPMVPLLAVLLLLWFFMLRSKSSQDRKRRAMLDNLKKGDRVQTIGGILGTVIEARESEVLLKVDESSNTKIRFARSAIHRVLGEEKTAAR